MTCSDPTCEVAVQHSQHWTASERQREAAYLRHGIRRNSYRWFAESVRELDHAEAMTEGSAS